MRVTSSEKTCSASFLAEGENPPPTATHSLNAMLVKLLVRLGRLSVPVRPCQARLQAVVRVARQTGFYRERIPGAFRFTEEQLGRLPYVEVGELLGRLDDFRSPVAVSRPPLPLHYPLRCTPKIAVLRAGFCETERVRAFPSGWCLELAHFGPESLAGPVDSLRRLAEQLLHLRVKLSTLRYPVLAFTDLGGAWLRDEDRDLFWRAFGVPVFEQLRSWNGSLLASECDAHYGLHLHREEAILEFRPHPAGKELVVSCLEPSRYPVLRLATGVAGIVDESPCACGENSSRLLRAAKPALVKAPLRAIAATA
jgi:hypothetical protein